MHGKISKRHTKLTMFRGATHAFASIYDANRFKLKILSAVDENRNRLDRSINFNDKMWGQAGRYTVSEVNRENTGFIYQ